MKIQYHILIGSPQVEVVLPHQSSAIQNLLLEKMVLSWKVVIFGSILQIIYNTPIMVELSQTPILRTGLLVVV